MTPFFTRLMLALIGVAVVWLVIKMSRSDAADLRLVALALGIAAALVAVFAGIGTRWRDRGHS